jgi:hypothetical protein
MLFQGRFIVGVYGFVFGIALWPSLPVQAFAETHGHRVSYDPYHGVNWQEAHRCLSQHHDHLYEIEPVLRAYDDAGYQAVSALHYSGLWSNGQAWRERHWPISDYMPEYDSDEEFLATCQNLRLFRRICGRMNWGSAPDPGIF